MDININFSITTLSFNKIWDIPGVYVHFKYPQAAHQNPENTRTTSHLMGPAGNKDIPPGIWTKVQASGPKFKLLSFYKDQLQNNKPD